jgi:hypothetical protein
MTEEKTKKEVPEGTGGLGLSRTPKTPGKNPRLSVSLPEELKDLIEKEAGSRRITVSKYISDILIHMHDENGINIPEPMPGGSGDLSPVLNAINALACEVRGVKTDVQDMKNIIYALPSGSAAQRSTIQKALLPAPDENIPVTELTSDKVQHYEAQEMKTPIEVKHSEAQIDGEAWIPSAELKKMFKPEYTTNSSSYSHLIADFRKSGELVGREPKKMKWEYEAGSVQKLFQQHPEYLA